MRNHSLLSQVSPLACLWKSITRIENNLSSSNLYHIKAAENRVLWYVTSKRKTKTKTKLFCTDSHMENCRGSEKGSKCLPVYNQKKILSWPVTKSPWSLLIGKCSHTSMCLYLLLCWEAAVARVLGRTSPCTGPEEHPSSQMLLSCKFSAVTPLIHMTTHSIGRCYS